MILIDGPVIKALARTESSRCFSASQKRVIAPVCDVLVRRPPECKTAQTFAAHRAREAVSELPIDQFVMPPVSYADRNPQPAKGRRTPFEFLAYWRQDRLAAYTVEFRSQDLRRSAVISWC